MQKLDLIHFGECRVKLNDNSKLVIHAGVNSEFMNDAIIKAYIDGKETDFEIVNMTNDRTRFCYKFINVELSGEWQFVIPVPDKFNKVELRVQFSGEYNNQVDSFFVTEKEYKRIKNKIKLYIDLVDKKEDHVEIKGWFAPSKKAMIEVYDGNKLYGCRVSKYPRYDMGTYYQQDEVKLSKGFSIIMKKNIPDKVKIRFMFENMEIIKKIDTTKSYDRGNLSKFDNLKRGINAVKDKGLSETFRNLNAMIRKKGIKQVFGKVLGRITGKTVYDYDMWISDRDPDKKTLDIQRKRVFDYTPVMSIVVPVYRPKKEFFSTMISSVLKQTYSNWELCLADGGGEGYYMEDIVRKIAKNDSRVKYVKLEKNLGIADNTNKAIELATGDYIVLGDHDDIIRPNALYECVRAVNKDRAIDVIYSDEDKYDTDTKKRIAPYFKPDFSPDMLTSYNYICHLFVFSRELLNKVGGFNNEYDGAQDYDMIFRCTEAAAKIKHIPKILYSWRCSSNSTASNPESKKYAFEAGQRAIQAHFDRIGVKAEVELTVANDFRSYKTKYEIIGDHKISIIIPNKDHHDDLARCIASVYKQSYKNFEVIIVENNSTQPITFEFYEKLKGEYENLQIVTWKGKFNYSAINNFGIKYATGDYIMLLNNDTCMINEDCIESMLRHSMRKEVGIVGAKLYFDDGTIQHAGVVMGFGGVAGHAFYQSVHDDPGYFGRAVICCNYSAVTAACLLVKTEIWHEVGGLEEELEVAYNDVDFNLKVREKGYLIVYDADAQLYHYESKSRGLDDENEEKKARFKKEQNYIITKWKKYIDKGDPYYNVNLVLTRPDFGLKD